jgi:hypothetical protein
LTKIQLRISALTTVVRMAVIFMQESVGRAWLCR